MEMYDDKTKPSTLKDIPKFLEENSFDPHLHYGHEALCGFQAGIYEMLAGLNDIAKKHPNADEAFRAAVLEFMEERWKFRNDLEDLWDDSIKGYRIENPIYPR